MSKGLTELDARKNAWENVNYEERFRNQILNDKRAMDRLWNIVGLLKTDRNVRLICYEKAPPCHRFILMDIIREMMNIEVVKRQAIKTGEKLSATTVKLIEARRRLKEEGWVE